MYALVQQNNYRSCSYDLFQLIIEKHKSKAATKNILKHTIFYIYCVYMLIWSLRKLYFIFYDFSCKLLRFFKCLAKINKKDKDKACIAKTFTKIYHIICSLCRSTYVESNKIGFSIYDFSVIYYNFQIFSRNN